MVELRENAGSIKAHLKWHAIFESVQAYQGPASSCEWALPQAYHNFVLLACTVYAARTLTCCKH